MPWVNRQKFAKLQLHADKPGSNTLPQYILLTQEKVNVNEQIKIGKIKIGQMLPTVYLHLALDRFLTFISASIDEAKVETKQDVLYVYHFYRT
jgi:hypothetical protein